MEEDQGSFNESVIVANLIFGVTPIVENKQRAKDSLVEQISELKQVLATFSETKTEIVSVESLD